MNTHDFQDGLGEVPAHRHPKGGGWVADTAHVDATAYVGPDARVSGWATVTGSAWVSGEARVSGWARVTDSATVTGRATVSGEAWVTGEASVAGSARVSGSATVTGSARVSGRTRVTGRTRVGETLTGVDLTDVPVVEDLDKKVLAALEAGAVDMTTWHCGTTHCRAGTAVHLAGDAGYALEERVGSWLAGALIYVKSTGRTEVPDFFASNDDARADIKRCAR